MMIWRKHAILTPPTDEEIAVMDSSELVALHSVYHEAIENAEKDPYHLDSGFLTGEKLRSNSKK